MKLFRLYAAIALLRGAGIVAGVIAGPDLRPQSVGNSNELNTTPKASKFKTSSIKAGDMGTTPVERLLLTSIVGIGICAVWIAMTWRAWS